jgi:Collagen triple helix repeat (20 copies)
VITRIHSKLGTAGFIISIVALVAALGGGAYAASSHLTGKQKKEVTKIAQTEAKKYAGKPGAPGATGPAGPTGPAGAAGTAGAAGEKGLKGDTGTAGANGTNGTNGTNGKSVEVGTATSTPTGECPEVGGATVQVAGEPSTKKHVCNGTDGTSGFTKTLPPGETETGAWTISAYNIPKEKEVYAPISFSIPLEEGAEGTSYFLTLEEIQNEDGEGWDEGCTGSVNDPIAPEGVLCVYALEERTHEAVAAGLLFGEGGGFGYRTTGSTLEAFAFEAGAEYVGRGTWAVTAPEAP